MSPLKSEKRYDTIEEENDIADLGHESDTTACSEGFLKPSSPSQRKIRGSSKVTRSSNAITWIRWATVIVLQSAVLIVLVLVYKTQKLYGGSWDVETGSDVNGLFKTGKFSS